MAVGPLPDRRPHRAAAQGHGLCDDGNRESESYSGVQLQGAKAWVGGPLYTAVMIDIYNKVTEVGLPIYHGAQVQLPSNMHFLEWEVLAHTLEDITLISFLKYGFPMRYEGPVPTPAIHNHIDGPVQDRVK